MIRRNPGALIKPKRNEKCLCGSGGTFRDCCSDRLPKNAMGDKYRKALLLKKWTLALKLARADLTRYLIWYKSHTEPFIFSGKNPPEPIKDLFDVDALSELADNIIGVLYRANQEKKILPFVSHLNDIIILPGWGKKTDLMRVYFYLIAGRDSDRAFSELKRCFSMEEIEGNIELSQVFIDAGGDQISTDTKMRLAQYIIDNSDDVADKLQYSLVKAIGYFESLQVEKANIAMLELQSLINTLTPAEHNFRFENFAAEAQGFSGAIEKDKEKIYDALRRFEKLQLASEEFTDLGKAELWRSMGECYRHLQKWDKSLESYSMAFSLSGKLIMKVFIAEAHVQMGNHKLAKKQLVEVAGSRFLLDDRELDDFAMHHAAAALAASDFSMVNESIEIIEKLETKTAYFRIKIKDDLIDLLKWKVENPKENVPEEKKGWLDAIILQPNLAGIGVNINHIISKLTRKNSKT